MVSTAKVGSMRLDPILHATLSGVLVDATRTLVGSCRSIQTSASCTRLAVGDAIAAGARRRKEVSNGPSDVR